MAIDKADKVVRMEPPTEKFKQSKAISSPIKHKQIKKAQNIKQAIAVKGDILNKEE